MGGRSWDGAQHKEWMESIDSEIMDAVLDLTEDLDPMLFNASDVRNALDQDRLGMSDLAALLSPAAENFLEDMASRAMSETRRYFGNSVSLFTPLYISNFCVNDCAYCGFSRGNGIQRARLSADEMDREMAKIAETGLKEILLLTGESRKMSDVDYIAEAVRMAAGYFPTVGIEVYPLNSDEYAYIHGCGADFVSVYQETYDIDAYKKNHPSGPKSVYPYRFNAAERALKGGMRGVGLGALLGLHDFREDTFAAGIHAFLLQKKYPHAEVSFSVPRIRPHINGTECKGVGERQLMQVMLAYRIFMPFSGITISTRERPGFRDNVVGIAANRISAGVSVGVGGHVEKKGDEQFEPSDKRDVEEVHAMMIRKGLQPVYSDHIWMR